MPTPLKIGIVGAGIGGLALAIALKQKGIAYQIFEAAGPEHIAYGAKATAVDPAGFLAIGQTRHPFDFVAVADGLRSHLRSPISERKPRYSGQNSWRGIAPIKLAEGAEIWAGEPGLRFGYVRSRVSERISTPRPWGRLARSLLARKNRSKGSSGFFTGFPRP